MPQASPLPMQRRRKKSWRWITSWPASKPSSCKEWERALRELHQSLEVVNSPNARLELARALRDSGKSSESWSEYGHVIDDANKLAAKEDRYLKTAEAATSERAEVESKLAFIVVSVQHAPADGTLKAGGRVVAAGHWSAPIVVSPGAVDVVLADASGKELARKTVAASVGSKTPVELDGQPSPPPVAVEEQPIPVPPPATVTADSGPSHSSGVRPYAYVAAGVGVAGLAAFTVFGLISNSTYSDLQGACHPSCPDKHSEISSGKTDQTVANVGLVVGLVGAATFATLMVVSLPRKASTMGSTGLVVAPGYIGWKGTL